MLQQGMLVRKRCYDIVGLFDETLIGSEDREMNLRLCRSFRGARIDHQTFILRRHTGSRGPSRATYSFSEREEKLREADQVVYRKLYKTTPLNEFLDEPTLQESDYSWRGSALITRAHIMAHRRLGDLARRDILEIRDQILCGNIDLSENIVRGILQIERTLRNALLPKEARLAKETICIFLNSPVFSKQVRNYVMRYFYWKGLKDFRAGRPTELISDFVKSLDFWVRRTDKENNKLS